NPENNEMPNTIEKEFELSGKVITNKNLMISAKFDEELDYKKTTKMRNKIYLSFKEGRNEFTSERFNNTFEELRNSTKEEELWKWGEIKQITPIRYTEFLVENNYR